MCLSSKCEWETKARRCMRFWGQPGLHGETTSEQQQSSNGGRRGALPQLGGPVSTGYKVHLPYNLFLQFTFYFCVLIYLHEVLLCSSEWPST